MESITIVGSGQAPAASTPPTAEQVASLRADVSLYKTLSGVLAVGVVGLGVYAVVQRSLTMTREQVARGEAYREVLTGAQSYPPGYRPPRGRAPGPPAPPGYGYPPPGYYGY